MTEQRVHHEDESGSDPFPHGYHRTVWGRLLPWLLAIIAAGWMVGEKAHRWWEGRDLREVELAPAPGGAEEFVTNYRYWGSEGPFRVSSCTWTMDPEVPVEYFTVYIGSGYAVRISCKRTQRCDWPDCVSIQRQGVHVADVFVGDETSSPRSLSMVSSDSRGDEVISFIDRDFDGTHDVKSITNLRTKEQRWFKWQPERGWVPLGGTGPPEL